MLTGSEDSPRLAGCLRASLRGRVQGRPHDIRQHLHRLHTTVEWVLGGYVTNGRDSPKEAIPRKTLSTKPDILNIA